MAEAIPNWLHVVGATIWVGPQFFVFLASVPALRTIDDVRQRLRALRVLTTRFNYLAWAGMILLVVTGIANYFNERDECNCDLSDYRWITVFSIKMTLVIVTVALTAFHSFWSGPRLIDMQEQALESGAEPATLASLRRASLVASSLALVGSLAILFMAALLIDHEFSFEPR